MAVARPSDPLMWLFFCLETETAIGRTPKGAYSTRGRSRHLLETPFSEPLLRTLLRTLFYCKTHRRPPSQNPSENPLPRTLPRTFSEPFSERCVAVRPLRRAPYASVSLAGVDSVCSASQNHYIRTSFLFARINIRL